jgi:serine/threonine protein kinase
MGEVWKAWDLDLSRWVAVKFLKGAGADEIDRFKREAQLAGKLNHPNIAAVYEVGEAGEKPYIAMQFVDGTTLGDAPRLAAQTAARVVRDAARAVDHAHAQGIIHRDLKPDNVMMTRLDKPASGSSRAPDLHVYVMDFGLARAAEGASGLTLSGHIVGTPSYMPPERARGDRVDARADVYSLGATLYELLTGRPRSSACRG